MSDAQAEALASNLATEFRRRMLDEYVPRIRQCVEQLNDEQLWQKQGTHGNSVGNLLLHLEGNVRQWMLAGIRGDTDGRDRDGEFAHAGEPGLAGPLLQRLQDTVAEACSVVDGLNAQSLLQTTTFQSRYQETRFGAVLHVLEHFSGHAGQIYAFTKQVLGIDLKFYDL